MPLDPAHYVGIPFVDRGRDVATGLDCWGLVRHWMLHERGVLLPSYDDAPSGEDDAAYLPAHIEAEARAWIRVDAPQPGDVLVLRIAGRPFHVGVFVGWHAGVPTFLHTLKGAESVYCSTTDPRWQPRIEGFYRHD